MNSQSIKISGTAFSSWRTLRGAPRTEWQVGRFMDGSLNRGRITWISKQFRCARLFFRLSFILRQLSSLDVFDVTTLCFECCPISSCLPIVTPLSRCVQHRRPGYPIPKTWPSSLWKRTCRWPRFGIRVPAAALYLPPVLDMALAWISPGKTFGGASDSSAPESTTASTKRNPPLGVLLATAHTDLASASFVKYWTRATRVYQDLSGTWLQLTVFLLPRLEGRIVVFL